MRPTMCTGSVALCAGAFQWAERSPSVPKRPPAGRSTNRWRSHVSRPSMDFLSALRRLGQRLLSNCRNADLARAGSTRAGDRRSLGTRISQRHRKSYECSRNRTSPSDRSVRWIAFSTVMMMIYQVLQRHQWASAHLSDEVFITGDAGWSSST